MCTLLFNTLALTQCLFATKNRVWENNLLLNNMCSEMNCFSPSLPTCIFIFLTLELLPNPSFCSYLVDSCFHIMRMIKILLNTFLCVRESKWVNDFCVHSLLECQGIVKCCLVLMVFCRVVCVSLNLYVASNLPQMSAWSCLASCFFLWYILLVPCL